MNGLLFKLGLKYVFGGAAEAGQWAVERLSERSTWLGFLVLAQNDWHFHFSGDIQTALTNLGLAFAGLLGVVLKEGVKK